MKKNLALLLLGALMSLPAFANLTADPIILSFAGTEDARKDIKVGNSSNRPQYLEISVSRITELGIFPETYFDSADPAEVGLLVAPRRIVLQPGEEKVIRVILLDREIETDKAWRVNISPVIGDINADKSVAVTMIGFKALVFARPDEPQSNIVGARDGQTLTLSNIGNTNVVLFDGEQCPVSETAVEAERDSETETECSSVTGKRLWPGAEWTVELPLDAPVTFTLRDTEEERTIEF